MNNVGVFSGDPLELFAQDVIARVHPTTESRQYRSSILFITEVKKTDRVHFTRL